MLMIKALYCWAGPNTACSGWGKLRELSKTFTHGKRRGAPPLTQAVGRLIMTSDICKYHCQAYAVHEVVLDSLNENDATRRAQWYQDHLPEYNGDIDRMVDDGMKATEAKYA